MSSLCSWIRFPEGVELCCLQIAVQQGGLFYRSVQLKKGYIGIYRIYIGIYRDYIGIYRDYRIYIYMRVIYGFGYKGAMSRFLSARNS